MIDTLSDGQSHSKTNKPGLVLVVGQKSGIVTGVTHFPTNLCSRVLTRGGGHSAQNRCRLHTLTSVVTLIVFTDLKKGEGDINPIQMLKREELE